MTRIFPTLCLTLASLALATTPFLATSAQAEIELSAYGGYQTSPHSRVEGSLPSSGSYSNLIGWEGKPFALPPYYGVRATYWTENNTGWALEWTHAKVYAGADMPPQFTRLEFTDGLNLITVNYAKRWPGKWGGFTPYVSGGLGISLPHVDVLPTDPADGGRTFGYQLTGAAARLTAGASYEITDSWRAFGEYQFTVSQNEADLDGGGTLSTRIITNSVNFGISYAF